MNTYIFETPISKIAVYQNKKYGFPVVFTHGNSVIINPLIAELL
jgi:hypothetical protein